MKKILTLVFILCLSVNLFAQKADLSPEAWQADIRYLTEQIPSIHPNAFHHVNAADFNAQAQAISKQAGSKQPSEIVFELIKLLARIGDGNTRLDLQSLNWSNYPIQLQYFGEELRAVATDSMYQRWLGMKALKIGQYFLPEVQEKLLPLVPANESASHAAFLMEKYLRYPEIMISSGVAGKRFGVLMFEDEKGVRIKAPLIARKESVKHWYRVQEEPPTHLIPPHDAGHPDLWITHLSDNTVNFVYAKDYPADKKLLKNIVNDLKTKFKKNPSSKVLLDLRQNESDDFESGKQLIKLIAKSARIKRGGQIYVAIGRQTYAAATLDALQLRDKYGAILLGEATGANPNGYRKSKTITLPNSGIRVLVATKEYKPLENHVGGLAPDHVIPMDWEAYRKGIDPILEWVLRQ